MDLGIVVICLLIYSLLRECLFHYERQKLINKLMSRNYHEYTVAKSVGKLEKTKAGRDDEGLPEDFNQLVGIG